MIQLYWMIYLKMLKLFVTTDGPLTYKNPIGRV